MQIKKKTRALFPVPSCSPESLECPPLQARHKGESHTAGPRNGSELRRNHHRQVLPKDLISTVVSVRNQPQNAGAHPSTSTACSLRSPPEQHTALTDPHPPRGRRDPEPTHVPSALTSCHGKQEPHKTVPGVPSSIQNCNCENTAWFSELAQK